MMMNLGGRLLMVCTLLLITSPRLLAQDGVPPAAHNNAFTMDVAVNIVGVEAAAQALAVAMQEVAAAINQALQSEQLSAAERQQLLSTLASFKGINETFSLSLENARSPINSIVADARRQLSRSAQDLNQSIVAPLAFQFQLLMYIVLAAIILLVLGIIVFIKVYILSTLTRVSHSAQNLASTIDNLPASVETIMKKVEADRVQSHKPRFMRHTAHKP